VALPHSTNIFKYPARFQFGQRNAPCGGQSCCTDTCIQMIVNFYKEINPSLAEIRRKAQAKTSFDERPCTGINHIETLNALKAYGITHYRAGFGVNAGDLWRYLNIGPVLVGVHYGSYPTKIGRCNKNNAEVWGKTDCRFNGSHAVLAIGKRYHGTGLQKHRDVFVRDPDHNSPARPEKPEYDRMRLSQFYTAMKNLPKYTAFRTTYILYPTQKKSL